MAIDGASGVTVGGTAVGSANVIAASGVEDPVVPFSSTPGTVTITQGTMNPIPEPSSTRTGLTGALAFAAYGGFRRRGGGLP